LSDRQQTQSKQPTATTRTTTLVTGSKQMKQEQVWHQVKNITAGFEFMEQMCFGTVSQKKQKSTPPPNFLLRIQPLLRSFGGAMKDSIALASQHRKKHLQLQNFLFFEGQQGQHRSSGCNM